MPHPSMGALLPSWGTARPLPTASAHGLSLQGCSWPTATASTSRCSPPGSTSWPAPSVSPPSGLPPVSQPPHCTLWLLFLFSFWSLSLSFSFCLQFVFVSKFIDTDRMLPHFLSRLVVSKMVQTTSLVPLGQLFRMSGGAEGTGPAAATSGPGRRRLAFLAGVPLSHCCPPSPGFLRLGPVLHAGPQGHSPRDQPVHMHPQGPPL